MPRASLSLLFLWVLAVALATRAADEEERDLFAEMDKSAAIGVSSEGPPTDPDPSQRLLSLVYWVFSGFTVEARQASAANTFLSGSPNESSVPMLVRLHRGANRFASESLDHPEEYDRVNPYSVLIPAGVETSKGYSPSYASLSWWCEQWCLSSQNDPNPMIAKAEKAKQMLQHLPGFVIPLTGRLHNNQVLLTLGEALRVLNSLERGAPVEYYTPADVEIIVKSVLRAGFAHSDYYALPEFKSYSGKKQDFAEATQSYFKSFWKAEDALGDLPSAIAAQKIFVLFKMLSDVSRAKAWQPSLETPVLYALAQGLYEYDYLLHRSLISREQRADILATLFERLHWIDALAEFTLSKFVNDHMKSRPEVESAVRKELDEVKAQIDESTALGKRMRAAFLNKWSLSTFTVTNTAFALIYIFFPDSFVSHHPFWSEGTVLLFNAVVRFFVDHYVGLGRSRQTQMAGHEERSKQKLAPHSDPGYESALPLTCSQGLPMQGRFITETNR